MTTRTARMRMNSKFTARNLNYFGMKENKFPNQAATYLIQITCLMKCTMHPLIIFYTYHIYWQHMHVPLPHPLSTSNMCDFTAV
jgi:hypothetical protein